MSRPKELINEELADRAKESLNEKPEHMSSGEWQALFVDAALGQHGNDGPLFAPAFERLSKPADSIDCRSGGVA